MRKEQDNALDDEVTAEEEAELKKLMESDHVPEPDEQEGASTDEDGDDDSKSDDAPESDDSDDDGPKPKSEAPADEDGDDADGEDAENDLAAFLERHKGKSAEELAKLAFQQTKRAGRAEFDNRQLTKGVSERLALIQERRDKRLAKIGEEREQFRKKVEDDPDAAVLEAHERSLAGEEELARKEAEDAEFETRVEAAITIASQAIPNFEKRAPEISAFAGEMGYTKEEVNSIADGRDLVTLHLAEIGGRLIKAGIIDTAGNFVKLPEPVEELDTKGDQKNPARQPGFGKQPARGAGRQKSVIDRLDEINSMSDEEFDKLDQAEVDALLKEAEAA